MYTLLGEGSALALILREVEVKLLGPVQLQLPPVCGCGPRFTVSLRFTVTLLACCHAPPFTCRYGTIAVGFTVMVNAWVLMPPPELV